ncbi:MAG: hypothetical protein R2769_02150 [Saprospiraceae bacterium]
MHIPANLLDGIQWLSDQILFFILKVKMDAASNTKTSSSGLMIFDFPILSCLANIGE